MIAICRLMIYPPSKPLSLEYIRLKETLVIKPGKGGSPKEGDIWQLLKSL